MVLPQFKATGHHREEENVATAMLNSWPRWVGGQDPESSEHTCSAHLLLTPSKTLGPRSDNAHIHSEIPSSVKLLWQDPQDKPRSLL